MKPRQEPLGYWIQVRDLNQVCKIILFQCNKNIITI